MRLFQRGAVIFAPTYTPGDLRWVGNERGYANATQWSTYPVGVPENAETLNVGIVGADTRMPAETDFSIRPDWYRTAETDDKVKSLDKLLDIYYNSVGHHTNLLLNFPVDNRGLVHENDAAALRALADLLKATFAIDLAKDQTVSAANWRGGDHPAYAPANVNDGDPETCWATDDGVGRLR